MNVKAVADYLSHWQETAVYFALMARFPVHPFRFQENAASSLAATIKGKA
ncbi:hypothetical protein HRJ45_02755 [Vibrio coralliilyticus]|nr:hypothetical protein [Vibrio coralliilyticus]NRF78012.1 hypothetical protein [Vibrio coralliilyticus]